MLLLTLQIPVRSWLLEHSLRRTRHAEKLSTSCLGIEDLASGHFPILPKRMESVRRMCSAAVTATNVAPGRGDGRGDHTS